jgi:hypothetical protein
MQPNVLPQAAEKVAWWLGETKGFWIQTGALILSAIGALWIVVSRSRSERRRATVDLARHNKGDKEFMEHKRTLLKLYDDGKKNFAPFLNQRDSPEYHTIMIILNMHEFIASGIREKAYDEKLYKRMQCSVVIRDWKALSGFVTEFRNSRDDGGKTFYQDFQWLAERWEKNPLKPGAPRLWLF